MKVLVNSILKELPDNATVAHVAPATTAGTAIAVNGKVVPRRKWDTSPLRDGDTVIIISAAYGG